MLAFVAVELLLGIVLPEIKADAFDYSYLLAFITITLPLEVPPPEIMANVQNGISLSTSLYHGDQPSIGNLTTGNKGCCLCFCP